MKKFFGLFVLLLIVVLAAVGFAQETAPVAVATPAEDAVGNILTKYWSYITSVIAIASIVVNMTPNETDNAVVKFLNKLLGFLAANFNVKGVANK